MTGLSSCLKFYGRRSFTVRQLTGSFFRYDAFNNEKELVLNKE